MTLTAAAPAAALCLSAAAWWLTPSRTRSVRRIALLGVGDVSQEANTRSRSWQPLAVVVSGVCAATVVGGLFGVLVGALVAVLVHRWLAARPATKRAALLLGRRSELPVVADLVAACLASGASISRTLQVVGRTTSAGLRADLQQVLSALELGATPDEAWGLVEATDLAPLAEVMCRSSRTGAPAASVLAGLAQQLRADARAEAMAEARRLGVRVAGPLGLCFLPAFIFIGVVPLVASLVREWA